MRLFQRRDRDSNPGTSKLVNGFRDRPDRPLRHLSGRFPPCPFFGKSGCKSTTFFQYGKIYFLSLYFYAHSVSGENGVFELGNSLLKYNLGFFVTSRDMCQQQLTHTGQPSFTSCQAMARPIPRDEPVTRAEPSIDGTPFLRQIECTQRYYTMIQTDCKAETGENWGDRSI